MKCGIDVGSTLLKAALYDEVNDNHIYLSTSNFSKEVFIERIKDLSPTQFATTGIGVYDLPFELSYPRDKDLIGSEIILQAKGAQRLMSFEDIDNSNFGLISIGTGISYTHCQADKTTHLPFGNFLGGGFLTGVSSQINGFIDNKEYSDVGHRLSVIDDLASCVMQDENECDLLVKDKILELNDSFQGEFIIASCGKLNTNSDLEQICFGLVNCIAASVMRDVMMYKTFEQFPVNQLVFIGSCVNEMNSLRKLLLKYSKLFCLEIKFPHLGEFAGALGALSQLGV